MLGELPQFYMFPCSHGNISGKKRGNKKRVVYVRAGSSTSAFLGTPLGSHPQVPLPQENTLLQEPDLKHITYSSHLFLKQNKSK
jgi:hypothetical protein